MVHSHKPNVLFWIIGILALLWNAVGAYNFLLTVTMPETLLGDYNEAQRALVENLPTWYDILFAIAVISGTIACIFLLFKKRIATTIFFVSLIAVIVQMGYWLFFTDARALMGDTVAYMPIAVIIVSLGLFLYSQYCYKKGWLS